MRSMVSSMGQTWEAMEPSTATAISKSEARSNCIYMVIKINKNKLNKSGEKDQYLQEREVSVSLLRSAVTVTVGSQRPRFIKGGRSVRADLRERERERGGCFPAESLGNKALTQFELGFDNIEAESTHIHIFSQPKHPHFHGLPIIQRPATFTPRHQQPVKVNLPTRAEFELRNDKFQRFLCCYYCDPFITRSAIARPSNRC